MQQPAPQTISEAKRLIRSLNINDRFRIHWIVSWNYLSYAEKEPTEDNIRRASSALEFALSTEAASFARGKGATQTKCAA